MLKSCNLFRNNNLFKGRIEAENNRGLISPRYGEEIHEMSWVEDVEE